MNLRLLAHVLSGLIIFLGGSLLVPLLFSRIYHDIPESVFLLLQLFVFLSVTLFLESQKHEII